MLQNKIAEQGVVSSRIVDKTYKLASVYSWFETENEKQQKTKRRQTIDAR